MLSVLRDPMADVARRDDMAGGRAACPSATSVDRGKG